MTKTKKSILVVTGLYPPEIGGPATYVKNLEEELPKHGFRVLVLPFSEVRFLPKIIRHLFFIYLIIKRGFSVDVIFAQDTVSVGLPSIIASRLLFKRFIVRVPGDYAWEQGVNRFDVKDSIDIFQTKKYGFKVELLRLIQSIVVGHSDLIIVPSFYFKKLVSGWVSNSEKIKVIYNGIPLLKPSLSKEEARVILNIDQTRIVFISAGRLVPWKGFNILIESVAEILKLDSNVSLFILGDGPDKVSLIEKIRILNLEKNIELIGSVDREKMMTLLTAGDIFILNTGFESFSFQIVEAMNIGIPIISTNSGNIPEIITNKEEGILVNYNNKEELIDAIKFMLLNKDQANFFTIKAREKSKYFSIQNTIINLIKFLK